MASDKQTNIELMEKLKIVITALDYIQDDKLEQAVEFLEREKEWLEKMLYQEPSKI